MSVAAAFILCVTPVVSDGDTIKCGNEKVRMAGIDAPDKTCKGRKPNNCYLEGPKGNWLVSRNALQARLRRGPVYVRLYAGPDAHARRIGVICVRRVNVNALMMKQKFAIYKPTWTGTGVRVKCPKP